MITQHFTDPGTILRMREGPLGPYIDGFATHLRELGYPPASIPPKLRFVTGMNRLLEQRDTSLSELDEQEIPVFAAIIGEGRSKPRGENKTLFQFAAYLRRAAVAFGPREPRTDAERIERTFVRYLAEERGLAAITSETYRRIVQQFLRDRFPDGEIDLRGLTAGDVDQFILGEASRVSARTAGTVVTGLRSFLRFLHVHGETDLNLAGSVPSVANRRLVGVPKYLSPNQVQSILESCDQETATGRRDYAILLTLARLGLRGGEVVGLTLDDIDWEVGEIQVCGRPGRTDRLPLPVDVGEAIVAYLADGRPRCESRHVFVRARAPIRSFPNSTAIGDILKRAMKRAGLEPVRTSSYLLRHTLATEMLNRGATLSEIGELLRHRHPDTTAIYAKLDLVHLRALALPWPEVSSDD